MASLLCVMAVALSAGPAWGSEGQGVVLRFDRLKLSELVRLVFADVLHEGFVFPDSFTDLDRRVSVDVKLPGLPEARAFVLGVLDTAGWVSESREGIAYVSRKGEEQGARDTSGDFVVYRPKYRSAAYLQAGVRSLVHGKLAAGSVATAVQSVASSAVGTPPAGVAGDKSSLVNSVGGGAVSVGLPDVVIFEGAPLEVERARRVLAVLDVAPGQVSVRAVVFEVTLRDVDTSAVQLVEQLLGGRLGISVGAVVAGSSISLKLGSFAAAFAALSQDSRFNAISAPSLRVVSGEVARLAVGSDVPILGAVTVPVNGAQSVQSVEYRPSGVIMDLRPKVYGDSVEIGLIQQVSSFSATSTGVNNSPTLLKRELSTVVSGKSGELFVVGGMESESDSTGAAGVPFLPRALSSKSSDRSRVQLVVMLQVDVI